MNLFLRKKMFNLICKAESEWVRFLIKGAVGTEIIIIVITVEAFACFSSTFATIPPSLSVRAAYRMFQIMLLVTAAFFVHFSVFIFSWISVFVLPCSSNSHLMLLEMTFKTFDFNLFSGRFFIYYGDFLLIFSSH